MSANDRYALQRYLFMTLDPVHPGAGGYRLGRVDLSIAREPGTRLPKIPGSSLHGAARSYAAYLYGTPEAAGQSQEKIDNPAQNPVCYTFGYLKGRQASSGVVNIFDAQILLFPLHSMLGPVWVSTVERLQAASIGVTGMPQAWPDDQLLTTWRHTSRLNLGWLLLTVAGQVQVQPPAEWQGQAWSAVADRIVLVSRDLFGHVVNSNLEVRTSVAIDPYTGAAEDKALFTYEAIPRATFLTAEVVLDDYNAENSNRRPSFPIQNSARGQPLSGGAWQGPLEVVHAGLKMMQYLGVGGMGTRGFGRIQIIGEPVLKTQEEIFNALIPREGRHEP